MMIIGSKDFTVYSCVESCSDCFSHAFNRFRHTLVQVRLAQNILVKRYNHRMKDQDVACSCSLSDEVHGSNNWYKV